jgi:general secretion pathway protein J
MNEKGITLLELIVALTIMGLIMVLLTSTMHLSFRSIEKGEAAVESLERMRASFRLISSQIQSALKPADKPLGQLQLQKDSVDNTLGDEDDDERLKHFVGDNEKLEFPTAVSLWSRPKGIINVTYTVEHGDNGLMELHASETNPLTEVTKEIKLLDGFDEIRFEYFVVEDIDAEEKGDWASKWDKEDIDFEDEILKRIAIHLKKGEKEITFIVPVRMEDEETQ